MAAEAFCTSDILRGGAGKNGDSERVNLTHSLRNLKGKSAMAGYLLESLRGDESHSREYFLGALGPISNSITTQQCFDFASVLREGPSVAVVMFNSVMIEAHSVGTLLPGLPGRISLQ
jgi:hypothetical protein